MCARCDCEIWIHLTDTFLFCITVEVEVLYDYIADDYDELTLKEGDVITDISEIDDGWWYGVLNGKRAMFPANYVKVSKK